MTKTRQWTVFTAIAAILVLAAGWFLLVKPQRSHASTVRDQATAQQQANQLLLTQIASLQSEEKNEAQEQHILQKFTTQVPDNAAEPTLIRQLSSAASGANVDLVSLTPGTASVLTATDTTSGSTSLTAPTAAGQVVEVPIAMNVTGTYPNVESFFQLLEKLPRALIVGNWSLCPIDAASSSSGSGGSGGAGCTAPAATGKSVPTGALSGTLNATVFYAPPAGAAATSANTLTSGTTGTTTPTTAATPAPSTAAATPAPSATTSAPAE